MTNLACNLIEASRRHPERVALRLDEIEVPYTGLDAASAARSPDCWSREDCVPATGCGVMLPNVPYFAIAYYGVLRAGGVVVPMNVLLKERETAFYLSDLAGQGGHRMARVRPGRPGWRCRRRRRLHRRGPGRVRGNDRRGRAFDRPRRPRRRRHRGDPLHVGHDRDNRRAPS